MQEVGGSIPPAGSTTHPCAHDPELPACSRRLLRNTPEIKDLESDDSATRGPVHLPRALRIELSSACEPAPPSRRPIIGLRRNLDPQTARDSLPTGCDAGEYQVQAAFN